jgi:hypothetical protein
MDFFAHGFWSFIFFHKLKEVRLAVLFGLLPDLISWVPFFFYNLFDGRYGQPNLALIPDWTFVLYGIGHSLVIALVVIGVVYLIKKKVPYFMFAWPIAIVMDIFTHTREFLPTPFLWPLSNWHFPGISWGSLWFMIINYILIVSCLVYIYVKKSKRFK